jgi:Trypsin Inhibitor like cysteine rich domain
MYKYTFQNFHSDSVFTKSSDMAVKLTAILLLLACVQGVFLQSVRDRPECEKNESYTDCGNLCEDNCDNRCDEPISQLLFSSMKPSINPECQPGCYCFYGYIRNNDGDCVLNTPAVCGK